MIRFMRLFRVRRSYAACAMPRTGTVNTFATTWGNMPPPAILSRRGFPVIRSADV
jgi:hypothetical protein